MEAAELVVIPMQADHLDSIAALEQACFSQPWSRAGLAAELQNPQAVFRVALQQSRPVGYVTRAISLTWRWRSIAAARGWPAVCCKP